MPGRLALQRVVADGRRRAHRGFDVARLDEGRVPQILLALVLVRRPDTGEAIRLQLDAHLQPVGARAVLAALLLLHLRQDAEQVLHVMADLVRDHIGLGELAPFGAGVAAAKAVLDLAEERRIEIDLLVVGTIERPHRAARPFAATRIGRFAIHHQHRRPVGLAGLAENILPLRLGAAEDARHEAADVVARRAGAPRLPARRRLARRLLLVARPAAGEDFGAADQHPRVDAERPADQAEHHDGADAQAAAADRHPETAAIAAAALFAAAVLDVVALVQIFPAHRFAPSPIPQPGNYCRVPPFVQSNLHVGMSLRSHNPFQNPYDPCASSVGRAAAREILREDLRNVGADFRG